MQNSFADTLLSKIR